jgi:cytochrome c biogenesis protein CcmG/thiol:disulfide interchange protein DsbE
VTGRARAVGQAVAIAAVASLLALLVWKVVQGNEGGIADALAKGENPVAPVFTLPRVDTTGDFSIASLRGKAVVVNFWASWCIPCKDEAPFLQKTYEKYGKQGLVVLGVDAQDFR